MVYFSMDTIACYLMILFYIELNCTYSYIYLQYINISLDPSRHLEWVFSLSLSKCLLSLLIYKEYM